MQRRVSVAVKDHIYGNNARIELLIKRDCLNASCLQFVTSAISQIFVCFSGFFCVYVYVFLVLKDTIHLRG